VEGRGGSSTHDGVASVAAQAVGVAEEERRKGRQLVAQQFPKYTAATAAAAGRDSQKSARYLIDYRI